MHVIYDTSDGNRIVGWAESPPGSPVPQAPGNLVAGPVTSAELALITDQIAAGFVFNEPTQPFQGFFEAFYNPGNQPGQRISIAVSNGGVPPVPADLAARLREERNQLLLAVDFTQLDDVPISSALRTSFATYRQALRDVPQQSGFPTSVTWPTAPQYQKT